MCSVHFWFHLLLVVVWTSRTQGDFHDVPELVAASESLITSTYEPPTNNDAYFENMTSSKPIGKL